MKVNFLILVCSLAMLTGCCTTGNCGGGSSGNNWGSSCGGGCVTGFWSTTCPTPNSNGASESGFVDMANPHWPGDYVYNGYDGYVAGTPSGCRTCDASGYIPSCGNGGCGSYSAGPNW
jgi:hypothetical protein